MVIFIWLFLIYFYQKSYFITTDSSSFYIVWMWIFIISLVWFSIFYMRWQTEWFQRKICLLSYYLLNDLLNSFIFFLFSDTSRIKGLFSFVCNCIPQHKLAMNYGLSGNVSTASSNVPSNCPATPTQSQTWTTFIANIAITFDTPSSVRKCIVNGHLSKQMFKFVTIFTFPRTTRISTHRASYNSI